MWLLLPFRPRFLATRDEETVRRLPVAIEGLDAPIPPAGALVVGKSTAKEKVIVFSDPDCPWCRKLHGEIRQVVKRDPGIAFFVRVYSRNSNPATVGKALSIVCGKEDSAKLLDDAFAGKPLPAANCTTDAVEV
ncbi:MAG TPA: thioredoxin domain-containing protein, partial [Candidatus Deferrimicrobiaceae bacterium]